MKDCEDSGYVGAEMLRCPGVAKDLSGTVEAGSLSLRRLASCFEFIDPLVTGHFCFEIELSSKEQVNVCEVWEEELLTICEFHLDFE